MFIAIVVVVVDAFCSRPRKVKASILLCIFAILMYVSRSFILFECFFSMFHSCFHSRFVVSEHSCLLIVDMFIVHICESVFPAIWTFLEFVAIWLLLFSFSRFFPSFSLFYLFFLHSKINFFSKRCACALCNQPLNIISMTQYIQWNAPTVIQWENEFNLREREKRGVKWKQQHKRVQCNSM